MSRVTGTAFTSYYGHDLHWDFRYNERNELEAGDRRQGTTPDTGTFMTPGDYDYTYDAIGNP